jgi:hypothetical protein
VSDEVTGDLVGGAARGAVDDPRVADEVLPVAHHVPVRTLLALAFGGLVLGILGVALASLRTTYAGTSIPWGVLLMLVTVFVCVRGASWLVGTRRGGAAAALGWLAATLLLSTTNPGGDVLLPDLPRTYQYLIGASVLVVLAAVWPLPPGARDIAQQPSLDPTPELPVPDVLGDGQRTVATSGWPSGPPSEELPAPTGPPPSGQPTVHEGSPPHEPPTLQG